MNDDPTPPKLTTVVAAALREPAMFWGAGVAVAMFLSIAVLPLFGVFFGSLTPAPLIYHYVRRGRVFGLTMIALAALTILFVYVAADRPLGVLVFIEYAILASLLAEGCLLGLTPAQTIGLATAVVLILAVVVVTFIGLTRGQSPLAFTNEVVSEQVHESLNFYEAVLGGSPHTETTAPGTYDRQDRRTDSTRAAPVPSRMMSSGLVAILVRIFPGLMIIGTLLVAWANFMFARVLLIRSGLQNLFRGDLKTWRAPELLVWVVVFSGFSLILPLGAISTLGLNSLLVLGLIYFFQGMSIIVYWLDKKKAPPLLRLFIYVVIALQQYLALIIAVLGLFDMWFDFRKIKSTGDGGT
jgi:hypothetical protein